MAITVVSQGDVTPPQPMPEAPKADEQKQSAIAQDAVEMPDESESSEEPSAQSDEQKQAAEESEQDKPTGAEKRIKKLLKERSDKARELEYWKSQAMKGQNPAKQESEKPLVAPKQEASKDGRPDPNTFEGTHAEYLEAVADYKADQKIKAWEEQKNAKERDEKVKTEVKSKVDAFQSKVKEFQKSHDDFQEVIEGVDDIPMSLGVQEAILESDIGPEVMYELSKNRELYERVNGLSIVAAAKEIGKIEARLAKADAPAAEEKQPNKITKAPKPLNPVGSKGTVVKRSLAEIAANGTLAEYEAARRQS